MHPERALDGELTLHGRDYSDTCCGSNTVPSGSSVNRSLVYSSYGLAVSLDGGTIFFNRM
ncbi:MAG TPA: hypothetical protein VKH42_06570 [Vicinamibacterales bacterium]|nr:hypothetical protein [Vicinamibacterales bacterium]